jgi:hypothetical protein
MKPARLRQALPPDPNTQATPPPFECWELPAFAVLALTLALGGCSAKPAADKFVCPIAGAWMPRDISTSLPEGASTELVDALEEAYTFSFLSDCSLRSPGLAPLALDASSTENKLVYYIRDSDVPPHVIKLLEGANAKQSAPVELTFTRSDQAWIFKDNKHTFEIKQIDPKSDTQ